MNVDITEKHEVLRNRLALIRRCQHVTGGDVFLAPICGAQALAFAHQSTTRVSYARSPATRYTHRRRVVTSIARYIRRQMGIGPETLSDPEIDLLSRAITGGSGYTYDVVSGHAITQEYIHASEITGSCMTGHSRDGSVLLYALNPNTVSLVVMRAGGAGIGRALLWVTDQGVTYMDRVYPDQRRGEMCQWATDHGYLYRDHGSCCDVVDGNIARLSVTLEHIPRHSCEGWPYMDTFRYYDDGHEFCARQQPDSVYRMVHTDGDLDSADSLPEDDGSVCASCGGEVDPHDGSVYEGDVYCQECYHDRFSECYRCGGAINIAAEGYTLPGGEVICPHCYRSSYFTCSVCGDICADDDNASTVVGGGDVCTSCSTDYVVCRGCSRLAPLDQCISIADTPYCAHCAAAREPLDFLGEPARGGESNG